MILKDHVTLKTDENFSFAITGMKKIYYNKKFYFKYVTILLLFTVFLIK